MDVRLKRVYEPASDTDGVRVLIDRLWPRGIAKDRLPLDLWLTDVAPSAALRRAWHEDPRGHEPERFAAFAASYRAELREPPAAEAFRRLTELARSSSSLTLLYAARDETVNHPVILREALLDAVSSDSGH